MEKYEDGIVKTLMTEKMEQGMSHSKAITSTSHDLKMTKNAVYAREHLQLPFGFNHVGYNVDPQWLKKVHKICALVSEQQKAIHRLELLIKKLESEYPVDTKKTQSILLLAGYLSDELNRILPVRVCTHCATASGNRCDYCNGTGYITKK